MTELEEWTPAEVHDAMLAGKAVLIDVREPHEFAAERIHGALLHPLSTFDPKALPADSGERRVIFQCAAGRRSAMAFELCREAGVDVRTHMIGGLGGWKATGLATVAVDPATGRVIDPQVR